MISSKAPGFFIFLLFLLATGRAAAFQDGKPQQLPLEPLTVSTAKGEIAFNVQVARTAEQKRLGLMYRRELPREEGMLFTYKYPEIASFWMRNTYIPLDILFISRDGVIINIARQTEPLSLETITSAGYVGAVLEINGGLADDLGIKAGDRVSHAFFEEAGNG